jgi:predicted PurR-regulated permease PerM
MHRVEDYFEVFIILFLIGVFLLMISSFLLPLLFAISLAFICYRPFLFFKSKFQSSFASAFVMTVLVLLLIVIPSYLVASSLVVETTSLVEKSQVLVKEISFSNCNASICGELERNLKRFQEAFDNILIYVGDAIASSLGIIFTSITSFVLQFIIFILSFFFLLKDGKTLLQHLRRIIPMKNSYKDALFVKFRDVSSAVFVHSLFIAFLQGALVGIAFYIFDLPSPIFWFVIASFAALLPMFGAALVWIPAAVYFFAIGEYISFILLSLYGLLIVGLIDNFLRPFLMKKKVHVHSFLIFLSIFGGMNYFGFIGLFIGPIIISLLVTVLQLYQLNFR